MTRSLRLAVLFLVLACVPMAALGWLGWRLLEQDRDLERTRAAEQLDNAAAVAAREVNRGLTSWQELLAAPPSSRSGAAIPPDAALLIVDARGFVEHHGAALPYVPAPAAPELSGEVFSAAEADEFRGGDLNRAADAYRRVAASTDPGLRGAALMRLARVLRRQKKVGQALDAYTELAALGETPVAGSPAELLARHERAALLTAMADRAGASREQSELASALRTGRYSIDRATFDFYRTSAGLEALPPESAELADAVSALWPHVQQQPRGRAAWTNDSGRGFAAVWQPSAGDTAVMVGPLDTLVAASLSAIDPLHVRLTFTDEAGRTSWGTRTKDADGIAKSVREPGLPWTVTVAPLDPEAAFAASNKRRRLWFEGFALMALVIAVASYLVVRSVNRELAVARLQSEFVATVSHEFRTPLTAMRHLTEMLEEGSATTDRLPEYFRALGKETRRLQALVESLLDFGRLESGARTYRMENISAAALATDVVDEFRSNSIAAGRIEIRAASTSAADGLHIRADREALTLAIRNLLDNAVKYSPGSSVVSVAVEPGGAFAGITVEDRGAGIPIDEQRDIFRKFVRGTAARALNVKGTGIGLAMVQQIVRAHGGRLELASEPGRGSRFTILVPLASHASHESGAA